MDMMLLGTGPDGHCGCLFPDTPEIKATGTGQIVLAGNDARADRVDVARQPGRRETGAAR